jgi:hypothetical protein
MRYIERKKGSYKKIPNNGEMVRKCVERFEDNKNKKKTE